MSYAIHDRAHYLATKSPDEIIDAAIQILWGRLDHGDSIASPDDIWKFAALKLGPLEREVFACLFLNNRHQVIAYEELFFGTIDGASVHPREVVKRALEVNAATLVLFHNHTSGTTEPSEADKAITRRLKKALALVEISVLDHVVVGGGTYVSFAERGLL